MHPDSSFTCTPNDADAQWHAYEFRFDRHRRDASIFNPDTGKRMELPRQDRTVDGFHRHENCNFSPELASYLRYLQTHHILLFSDSPELIPVTGSDELDASDDDWDEEGHFSYHTLIFRTLTGANTSAYCGFSFIDGKLYSGIYIYVEEFS